jgi:hypothetical protein
MRSNKGVKPVNRGMIWLYAGVFLLLQGISLENGLADYLVADRGYCGMGQISARVCETEAPNQPGCYFTPKEVEKVGRYFRTRQFGYFAQTRRQVSGKFNSVKAELVGVNSGYHQLNSSVFTQGNFFSREAADSGDTVAVIDDTLAQALFGGEAVAGLTLTILKRNFRIVGVKRTDHSVIHGFTDSQTGNVYLPFKTLTRLCPKVRINYFQVRTADSGTVGENSNRLTTALRVLGKKPQDYQLVDYHVEHILLTQKPKLTLFLIGITVICGVLKLVGIQIGESYRLLRRSLETEYLSRIIKKNAGFFGTSGLLMILTGITAILIWKGISFTAYIAPEYIPEELNDLAFYQGLFQEKVKTGLSRLGSPIPEAELTLYTVRGMSDLVFWISNGCGWILFYGGLFLLRKQEISGRSLCYYSIFLVAGTTVSAALTTVAGLPVKFEAGPLILFWVLIAGRRWGLVVPKIIYQMSQRGDGWCSRF